MSETPEKKATWKGWLALVAIFIGLPVAGVLLIWRGQCAESSRGAFASADALFTAEVTIRDCGTAIKPATIVRLRDAAGKIVEDVLILHGETPVDVRWDAPRTLSIGFPKEAVVVQKRRGWEDVSVVFR